MTPEFQAAFERGRWDMEFFTHDLLGLDLHGGQKRMADAYMRRDTSGWRALFLWLMVSAGNRAGKTLGVAVIIMHACLYKMGLPPPKEWTPEALRRWQALPFEWYHFGVQQEVADIVFVQIINILLGHHEAQKEGRCPLADMAGGADHIIKFPWDRKYKGDYAWVQFTEPFGGAQVHFRSTSESALGSLGQNAHGVSFDEVGVQKQRFEYVINEVLDTRRLSTGGQFILISTPAKGYSQEWADLWYTGDYASPDKMAHRFSMRMSTRDNIGFGIDPEHFSKMIEDRDQDWIDQNIDGHFIQDKDTFFSTASINNCFYAELPEHQGPREKHLYLQGIDPAIKQDSSWSLVFDAVVLPRDRATGELTFIGVEAKVLQGQQTVENLMSLALDGNREYSHPEWGKRESRCLTGIDSTGFGGVMFTKMIRETIPDVVPISFSGSPGKKDKMLGDLRTMIDSGRLLMPKTGLWLRVRRQLIGYKRLDRHLTQDAVMALAIMVTLRKWASPTDLPSVPFNWSDR